MATVQSLNLAIISNDDALVIQSALNLNANDPQKDLINIINFLVGVLGGAYGNVKVTATLPDTTQVVFSYGTVVSSTVTPTITRTSSVTPTPTTTLTPTPTVTPTH